MYHGHTCIVSAVCMRACVCNSGAGIQLYPNWRAPPDSNSNMWGSCPTAFTIEDALRAMRSFDIQDRRCIVTLTYDYVYMCIYTQTFTYRYVSLCISMYVYACIYIYTYIHTHVHALSKPVHAHR